MRIYKNDIIKASAISTGADRGMRSLYLYNE